ncbi:MAG: hypothetical protein ACFFKA_00245 [Candidatus Thorarchaeota archaeon]
MCLSYKVNIIKNTIPCTFFLNKFRSEGNPVNPRSRGFTITLAGATIYEHVGLLAFSPYEKSRLSPALILT